MGSHLHSQRGGRALHRAELARPGRYARALKERHSLHAGSDLFEQLQPFRADAIFVQHKTSSVAARPGEALHETGADRFGDLCENDRHGTSCLQQCSYGCTAGRDDHVGREGNQFRRVAANALRVGRAPTDVNADVATVDPA